MSHEPVQAQAPLTSEPSSSGHAELLTSLGRLYPQTRCRILLDSLIHGLHWQTEYHAFGRRFDVPRVQAWYADPGVHYRYSNNLLAEGKQRDAIGERQRAENFPLPRLPDCPVEQLRNVGG